MAGQVTYRPNTSAIPPYTPRSLPDANGIEERVNRLAKWATDYIVQGVQALKAADRPILTRAVPKQEMLAQLLSAPEGFWTALEQIDPETAVAFVAMVLKARQAGKLPETGPQFNAAEQQAVVAQQKQEAEETQRQLTQPLESRAIRFALKPTNLVGGP